MFGEHITGKILVAGLIVMTMIRAQDTLLYPELLNPQAMETLAGEGQTSFKVEFVEALDFRTKAQFTYKGVVLSYRNEGGDKEDITHQTSLALSAGGFDAGTGYGRPNIAKGLVLGNTMMRFSPALSGQAGIRPVKIRVNSTNQYKTLIFAGYKTNAVKAYACRYRDVFLGTLEYTGDHVQAGLAGYGLRSFILESWVNLKRDNLTGSLNISLTGKGLNHICMDVLYKVRKLTLYGSGVMLGKDFRNIKADSKWGSGLQSGGRGLALGAVYSKAPWTCSGIAYGTRSPLNIEQRCMLTVRYKKRPFEIKAAYSDTYCNDIIETDIFPYGLAWMPEKQAICKLDIIVQLSSMFKLKCQLQSDLEHACSHAAALRLEYKNDNRVLKIQFSNSQSAGADLYYIRPLTPSGYGIRKAPPNMKHFIDVLYSIRSKNIVMYVLLRNEGLSAGFDYDL